MRSNQFPDYSNSSKSDSGWFLFDPAKGAENQANKKPSAPVYDAPAQEKLNSDNAYEQALKYNSIQNRQLASLNNQAMKDASNVANDANIRKAQTETNSYIRKQQADKDMSDSSYANKLLADYNQAVRMKNLNMGAGGGSSAFGMNAPPPSGYSIDAWGNRGLYNWSNVAKWQQDQMMVANNNAMMSRAAAAGDIARMKAQVDADKQRMATEGLYRDRQNVIDAQRAGQDRLNQQKLAQIQQQTELGRSAIGAQGNILGSLFSSVGAGSPNYRYWG